MNRAACVMSRNVAVLLSALLALSGCLSLPIADRVELHGLKAELMRALRERDGPTLDRLLAADFRFVHSTGVSETKDQLIQRTLKSNTPWPELETSWEEIRTYPGCACVVWHTRTHRKTPAGAEALEFIGTDVLVRDAGRWRWAAVQSTRVPADRRPASP